MHNQLHSQGGQQQIPDGLRGYGVQLLGWLLGLAMLLIGPWAPDAQAAPLCRTIGTHQVCILKITRSAKYYWEYRAEVTVDEQRRPMGRYNCRTGEYVDRQGKHVPDDIAAQAICGLFKQ